METQAEVIDVIQNPRGGKKPYAVARAPNLEGTVTFTIGPGGAWLGAEHPHRGQTVYLTSVTENAKGFRAAVAKPAESSDGTPETQKFRKDNI